jgi:hypothetical protein
VDDGQGHPAARPCEATRAREASYAWPDVDFLGNWQRFAVYGAVHRCWSWALLELDGYRRGERKLWEYQAAQAKAAVPVVVKQGAVTERVVTKYRDRVRSSAKPLKSSKRRSSRYVPPSADPVLPRGWVVLHDAAAAGAIPEAADGVDVAAPAVAASQAAKGVVANYGACHATEAQLEGLQEWVREQYQVMNLEPLGY